MRRRLLAAPPSVVLALCIFAPALRVCGDPVYPIQVPPVWTPYVLGLIVAGLVLASSASVIRGWLIAAHVVFALTAGIIGIAAIGSLHPEGLVAGPIVLAVGGAIAYALSRGNLAERAAHAVIATGIVCTLWFAFLCTDSDAMWGAYTSLAASLALLFAGLEWRRVLRRERVDAVPRARAHVAGARPVRVPSG